MVADNVEVGDRSADRRVESEIEVDGIGPGGQGYPRAARLSAETRDEAQHRAVAGDSEIALDRLGTPDLEKHRRKTPNDSRPAVPPPPHQALHPPLLSPA